jgi:hypothetical protein
MGRLLWRLEPKASWKKQNCLHVLTSKRLHFTSTLVELSFICVTTWTIPVRISFVLPVPSYSGQGRVKLWWSWCATLPTIVHTFLTTVSFSAKYALTKDQVQQSSTLSPRISKWSVYLEPWTLLPLKVEGWMALNGSSNWFEIKRFQRRVLSHFDTNTPLSKPASSQLLKSCIILPLEDFTLYRVSSAIDDRRNSS